MTIRMVWRYQRGSQKRQIEEGQTTQWPTDEGQTTIYKALYGKHILVLANSVISETVYIDPLLNIVSNRTNNPKEM